METIQVVLDSKLLRATDRAASLTKVNRSALIRKAISAYLKRLEIHELEERDRRGYEAMPSDEAEAARWETEAAWPVD
jgi:metal-responsive CopG/Arc/MetJ family transcriptional regulator